MAEMDGFEPTHAGIKVRCLTAWLHPCMRASYLRQPTGEDRANQVIYRPLITWSSGKVEPEKGLKPPTC